MAETQLPNLDRLAAKTAQEIVSQHSGNAKELENWVTKALGVLQENGVYACLLYLYAQSENYTKTIRDELLKMLDDEMLKSLRIGLDSDLNSWEKVSNQLLEERKLFDDLDKLFLVKELFEQTLIYARYGAKAAKVGSEGTQE